MEIKSETEKTKNEEERLEKIVVHITSKAKFLVAL